jgi:hypothetical protein
VGGKWQLIQLDEVMLLMMIFPSFGKFIFDTHINLEVHPTHSSSARGWRNSRIGRRLGFRIRNLEASQRVKLARALSAAQPKFITNAILRSTANGDILPH